MPEKIRVLFLCTGNSCRSQMAEAWTRVLKGESFDPYSGGIEPRGVDPLAIEAMREVEIDISNQRSKDLDTFQDMEFDYVITLCSHAQEACPFFPAKTSLVHHGFDDPPALAYQEDNKENALKHYRRVRDEIKLFVEGFPETLQTEEV